MTQPQGEPQPNDNTPTPTPAPKPGDGSGGAGGGQPQDGERTFTQREVNALEKRFKDEYRTKRESDEELIELGRKAKEALDAKRPLEERVATITGENATITKERDDLKTENLRMKLAGKARLHPDLWDRVRGDTEDAINADIETLKKFSPAEQGDGHQPGSGPGLRPNPQQGLPQGDPNAQGSVAAGRDLHSRRHGQKQGANT